MPAKMNGQTRIRRERRIERRLADGAAACASPQTIDSCLEDAKDKKGRFDNRCAHAVQDADMRGMGARASHAVDAKGNLQLVESPKGLALAIGGMELRTDFTHLLARANPGKVHQELLVKAAKIKNVPIEDLLVVDATAGLGEDAFLLAAAGFSVVMFERDETIAALLEDGLGRAASDERLSSIVARMTLHEEDSIAALAGGTYHPDVILLDPMFPARTKSASVKKKFQLIHELEAPCADEQELLDAAISAHPRKIVIKRPAKGPWLAQRKPSYSLAGKAVRYDCLVLAPSKP